MFDFRSQYFDHFRCHDLSTKCASAYDARSLVAVRLVGQMRGNRVGGVVDFCKKWYKIFIEQFGWYFSDEALFRRK